MPRQQSAGAPTPAVTITAVRQLAVPTGTAAATVVADEPFADPAIESRRFARLAASSDIAFRAQFEELIVSGVYTVLHNRVLVLRVIHGGRRSFAVVGEDAAAPRPSYPRAGLQTTPQYAVIAEDVASESGLQGLVESEARQRPVFHGVTPGGMTYSGFSAVHSEPLLRALNQAAGEASRSLGGITVFALGSGLELPSGLVVGVDRAVE